MNKHPDGLELKAGELVRFNGVIKEVEIGNVYESRLECWTSVKFVGEDGYYFTHKGGIEKYETICNNS